MKDYRINGKVIEITLENDKIVKCSKEWAEKTIKLLDTDLEDVLLMWLEDNEYLENEEQQELDNHAKSNKIKLNATDTKKKKTPKERVAKAQPEKEFLISLLAKALENDEITNVNVENKAKIITFSYKNANYKLDLIQKRPPKAEK